MDIHDSLLDLIGDTPLVRLSRIAAPGGAQLLAKLEQLNPGGSVKDRIAVRMVETAEATGALKPGGTIVEPTRENRCRPCHRRCTQGLQVRLRDARQDEREKIKFSRVWRAGRGMPDRRCA